MGPKEGWVKAFIVFVFGLFLFSLKMQAVENPVIEDGSRWWGIGLDLGNVDKSNIDLSPSLDAEKSGTAFGIYGFYSSYAKRYVYDIGLGFRSDQMKKSGTSVYTSAASFKASYRYRLTHQWSLGPELLYLVGDDVSFSDTTDSSLVSKESSSTFLGLSLMYDLYQKNQKKNNITRLGFRYFQDISIDQRKVSYLQLVFEYTWPPRRAQKILGVEKAAALSVNLDNANLGFVTGSSELTKKSTESLDRLANLLLSQNDVWEFLDIEGHTDKTGENDKNKQLSWDRAESVKQYLVSKGVSENKLDIAGYGSDKPLLDEESVQAYKKNRRVELKVVVRKTDPKFLQEMMEIFE